MANREAAPPPTLDPVSPLSLLQQRLAEGSATPVSVAQQALALSNGSASRNTYLSQDEASILRQAAVLAQRPQQLPLRGVPISLKDCFDLAGAPTTCGSRFYARRPPPAVDSAMAARLRAGGALITGKTHLHPLAYGITGQNAEYGDCLQPRDAALLTGGSSSGAAASVQEGSALAAVGTDTGGSLRVPAALCGLVAYRASHRLAAQCSPSLWAGAAHLAPSFDTPGFLVRDPRDLAPVAQALFAIPAGTHPPAPRVGWAPGSLLHSCEPAVLDAYQSWKHLLAALGAHFYELDVTLGSDTVAIFTGIQAHEAATLHRGHFHHFEPVIRERLHWGASLSPAALAILYGQLAHFRAGMAALLQQVDFLLLPCAPVSRLPASADLTPVRSRILPYTAPFSLAGLPVLSLPGELVGAPRGAGVQVAAAPGADAALLSLAQAIGSGLAAP